MTHKGTVYMETDRLVLRPFTMEDTEPMFVNCGSDVDVTRYMTWTTQTDVSETETSMKGWVGRYANPNFYHWAIVEKEENNMIGFVSVIACDENVKQVEMGYAIGKKWWGKGYMAEALGTVIDYLFNEVGVNRIYARHDTNNPGSGKVMQKCGMKYEGTMRQSEITNNGLCDIACYAILAKDKI